MCIRDRTYSMLFGMSRRAASIVLTPEEGSTLERWSRARSIPARLVQRARIVRLAARQTEPRHRRGVGYFSAHCATVAAAFLGASAGRTGKGRPSARTPAAYLSTKSTAGGGGDAASKPSDATHWSTRTMARAQGLSAASVRRIWKQPHLKPHLTKTFKLSRDPQFVEKLQDVVGLYLNPPEKALVLCVCLLYTSPSP